MSNTGGCRGGWGKIGGGETGAMLIGGGVTGRGVVHCGEDGSIANGDNGVGGGKVSGVGTTKFWPCAALPQEQGHGVSFSGLEVFMTSAASSR